MPVRTLTLTILIFGLAFSAVPTALAVPDERELQEQINEAASTQQELEGSLGGAQAELDALEAEFQLTVDNYNAASEELASLEDDIARQEEAVARYRSQSASARSKIGRSARSLYISGIHGGLPALLTGHQASDLTRRLTLVEAARTSRLHLLEDYQADAERYEASLDLLETAYDKADAKREELSLLQAEIEQKVESQRDDIARLEAEIARQAALRAEREERLAAIRAERERQQAAERAERQAAAERTATNAAPAESAPAEAAPKEAAPKEAESNRAPAGNSKAAIAVQTALAQVGKPYQWAGSGPHNFDCSGLTSYAWRAAGVSLPHNSGMQYNATMRVSRSELQPGDLLFFYNPISHVSMYIGDGMMVEAPYSGKTVRVRSIERSGFVGAGRPRY